MDRGIKTWIVAGGWILYVVALAFSWSKLTAMALASTATIQAVIYFATNPAYIMLVYGIIKYSPVSKLKSTVASVLLVFAFDLVSSPRVLMSEVSSASMAIDSASILIKKVVAMGIPQLLAWNIVYVILPIAMFLTAMELLGVIELIRRMQNGGG